MLLGTVQLLFPEWSQCFWKLTRHGACCWKLWPQKQLQFGFLNFIYIKKKYNLHLLMWARQCEFQFWHKAWVILPMLTHLFSSVSSVLLGSKDRFWTFFASVITVMYPLSSKQLFNVFQPGLKISHKSQNNHQILIITPSIRRRQFYGEGVTETSRFLWCFPFFLFPWENSLLVEHIASRKTSQWFPKPLCVPSI